MSAMRVAAGNKSTAPTMKSVAKYYRLARSNSTFLHGVETTEVTTGPSSIIEVATCIIGIVGTAELAEKNTLVVVRNMDDVKTRLGAGSIYDALRRVYQYITNTTVVCLPLGKTGDFTEQAGKKPSGVAASSATITLYDTSDITSPTWQWLNPNKLPVTFASSDDTVLTVEANGTLVPEATGTATLTLTVDGGDNFTSDVLTVAVTVASDDDIPAGLTPSSAHFNVSTAVMYTAQPGRPVVLTNPDNQAVTWSGSDDAIGLVDPQTGEVTPRAKGALTLTAHLAATSTVMAVDITCSLAVQDAPDDALLAAFIAALPLFRKSRQLFGFTPKVFMAPGIVDRTGALGPANALGNQLRGVWLADMPTSITSSEAAFQWKQLNATYPRVMVEWPRVAVLDEDGGTQYDWVAPSKAGLICQIDKGLTGADFETGYWCSPSNYQLIDVVGVEQVLEYIPNDPDCEVNYLNSQGITTVINNLGGYRAFGNRSGAFPGNADATTFFSWRRVCDIIEDSIEWFTVQYLDRPMFTRPSDISSSLVGIVCDSVNDFLRSKVGTALVYGRCEILLDENPLESLQKGIIKYHYMLTPPVPMEHVQYTSEVYITGLEDAFRKLIGG